MFIFTKYLVHKEKTVKMLADNIFNNVKIDRENELFETIISNKNVKIERIISYGHTTATGECYDQEWDEWVMILKGSAVIRFYDPKEEFALNAGDYIFIPSQKKHRVEFTRTDDFTIWLAIHIFKDKGERS